MIWINGQAEACFINCVDLKIFTLRIGSIFIPEDKFIELAKKVPFLTHKGSGLTHEDLIALAEGEAVTIDLNNPGCENPYLLNYQLQMMRTWQEFNSPDFDRFLCSAVTPNKIRHAGLGHFPFPNYGYYALKVLEGTGKQFPLRYPKNADKVFSNLSLSSMLGEKKSFMAVMPNFTWYSRYEELGDYFKEHGL